MSDDSMQVPNFVLRKVTTCFSNFGISSSEVFSNSLTCWALQEASGAQVICLVSKPVITGLSLKLYCSRLLSVLLIMGFFIFHLKNT